MKFVNFVDELTRLQPFLYRFAYSLTKNHEAAKDLLQETLLKTLENREKFIEDTNLRAWMCAIMKNTFINDYRKLLLAHESVCRIDDLKSEPCMIDGTDANYDLDRIAYNKFTGFSDLCYNILGYLMTQNEDIWKLLKRKAYYLQINL